VTLSRRQSVAGAGAGAAASGEEGAAGVSCEAAASGTSAARAASMSSPQLAWRSSGSLASAFAITPSIAAGSSGRTAVSAGGGSWMCA
jgi:hypothetical protein